MSGRCGKAANGEQLVCQGDVCEVMACPAGQSGCACRGGTACNAPGDACTNGFCVAAGCTAGSANCTCIAGTCDVGLTCLDNTVCVDNKGYEGGACLDTGRCYRGSRCDSSTNTCVYCDPGTPGCQCTSNGGCNAGLTCAADMCLAASSLPPSNPACYTPCLQDFTRGGQPVTCGADGLAPGCLDGQQCTQGSCLNPGQTKPSCNNDSQCPVFQACLAGGCYSNCEVNADCAAGLGCFKKACRATCRVTTGQGACPTGFACSSEDGQNGYCTPIGTASSSQAATTPRGGLYLPQSSFELSNVKSSTEFIVVPKSDITQDVTVRKKWHEIVYSNGDVERVEAPIDSTNSYRACNPAANECPLWWLDLSAAGGAATKDPTLSYRLIPNCVDDVTTQVADAGASVRCPRVKVANAGGVTAVRWRGGLELTSGDSRTDVVLSYIQRPEGHWTGSMYYFGTFNDTGLNTTVINNITVPGWIQSTDKSQVNDVQNGLIRRWGALRGQRGVDGWKEFIAVLTATRTESWKAGIVAQRCIPENSNSDAGACYPYGGNSSTASSGVRVYVDNLGAYPIPSGVTELPFAMNLRISSMTPQIFEGRVESSLAMHYPGNPELKLEFAANPADANSCFAGSAGDCMVFLKGLDTANTYNRVTSAVGARTLSTNGLCDDPQNFTAVKVPWLVPGFEAYTSVDNAGVRWRTECRENRAPFVNAAKVNEGLAGANPSPDGTPRTRTLRFIDGALVNQSQLFILFEETYESFIKDQPPSRAYGYILLKRSQADLDGSAYTGRPTVAMQTTATQPKGATCNMDMVRSVLKLPSTPADITAVSTADQVTLVNLLITGRVADADYACIGSTPSNPSLCSGYTATQPAEASNQIHYWCEGTGYFNGGPEDYGTSPTRVACPAGSRVIYFNAGARTDRDMALEACQNDRGTDGRAKCFDRLQLLKASGAVVEMDPVYRCKNGQVLCNDDRLNLRSEKQFYRKMTTTPTPAMVGLRALIDSAFRYKTRFRSTTGGSLGFAPRTCAPNSDAVPYCYNPKEIEEARERIDCLIDIYSRGTTAPPALDTPLPGTGAARNAMLAYLKGNFSEFSAPTPGEGFERLYAELLIMQGDESLTSAYASRFDLAAAGGASFKGSAFEAGGIDLTGVAGAEMYQLYQAVQYYQLALDRLYGLGPNMRKAYAYGVIGTANNFISPTTLTTYLERLVRAASQKSRAWGEIAKRYQNFNRPDLARAVIERAYVGTYLESALISRLMLDIAKNSSPESQAQNRVTLEKAQRNYRMALLDMREIYQQITDEVNFFGYPADYIPFPPLDSASSLSSNAFEALLSLAKQRLDLAKQREQVALSSAKQGRVDAAQFQSDLTSIRNTYENQLAAACGVFKGDDGRVYPAIRKYAHQSPVAMLMGDPCGRMGNGEIHNAMANVKDAELRLKAANQAHANTLEDIDIERRRVAEVCGLMLSQTDFQFRAAQRTAQLQEEMAKQRAAMNLATGIVSAIVDSFEVLDCEIQCASSAAMAATVATAGIAAATAQYGTELRIASAEADLKELDAKNAQTVSNFQCQAMTLLDGGISNGGILEVESKARVAQLFNDTLVQQLEALRAEYSLHVAVAEVGRMFSNAQRIQAQQEEAEQLAIDIQQAQNDPNVRIYQNDAVINADVSFQDALATAYRLTRVFEYYTSQSYARKEQLFLIRMVSAGQYNLENYLLELENEFINFEEQFGVPDLRVMALSLRDDILKIPYLKQDGTPIDEGTRINMLREALKDVKLLDNRGYLTLPFSTNLRELSPVTRNHKVHHVEIDLQGNRMGDSIARVYLRMAGTGVVRNVSDDLDYYVFPERLGVINASILGTKVFDPDVYRNYRFRDRPLVNTLWELVLNQRDELANKDIDLGTLSDIRILFYYSDFTSF